MRWPLASMRSWWSWWQRWVSEVGSVDQWDWSCRYNPWLPNPWRVVWEGYINKNKKHLSGLAPSHRIVAAPIFSNSMCLFRTTHVCSSIQTPQPPQRVCLMWAQRGLGMAQDTRSTPLPWWSSSAFNTGHTGSKSYQRNHQFLRIVERHLILALIWFLVVSEQ